MERDRADEMPVIAAAVVTDASRVLLIRRRIPEGPLRWQFPAGVVEPGKSVAEAAVREASEEAGVTVAAVRSLGVRVHPLSGRTVAYTACRLLVGVAHPASLREVAEVAWVTLGELPDYVPGGVYGPVQIYLDEVLGNA